MKSFIFVALILVQTISLSFQAPPPVICDGKYFFINKDNGNVLEIEKASKECGANLALDCKDGGKYQQFVVDNVCDGYVTLKNVNSGLYLSIENKKVGSLIEQVSIKGNPSAFQLFKITKSNSCPDTYLIQSKASGLYINGDSPRRSYLGNDLAILSVKPGSGNIDFLEFFIVPVC